MLTYTYQRFPGLKPLFFRPPYGDLPDLALAALDNRGYKKVFLWNQDAGDANDVDAQTQKNMYDGVSHTLIYRPLNLANF